MAQVIKGTKNVDKPKYSLHLFAGAGGGLQADIIEGTVPICAVEIEKHAQQVLAKRFPWLAIWDDVRTFTGSNPECGECFNDLREVCDELIIAGGFPCQDISSAGKMQGLDGERSGLWKEFARIICEVRPRFVFVENSPNLVRLGLGRVLADLASMGYDGAWGCVEAAHIGARHHRNRFWGYFKRRD